MKAKIFDAEIVVQLQREAELWVVGHGSAWGVPAWQVPPMVAAARCLDAIPELGDPREAPPADAPWDGWGHF